MASECQYCGVQLPECANFCSHCGSPVTLPEAADQAIPVCGYCEIELGRGAKFCHQCGEPAVTFSQAETEIQQLMREAPIDRVVDFDDLKWRHIIKERARRYVRYATRNYTMEAWAPLLYQQGLLEAVVAWAWSIEATTLSTTNPKSHEALFQYAGMLWLLYDVGPFGKGYIHDDWTLAPEVVACLRRAGYSLAADASVKAPPLPHPPIQPKQEQLPETKRSLAPI